LTDPDLDGGAAIPEPLDEASIETLRGLTVAVIADALDRLGYRHQVMDRRIRPVASPAPVFGQAFTIQGVASAELRDPPYEMALAATDAIPRGAIVIFNAGGVMDAGVWGELLTTRALARGGVGAVVDGAVRDLAGIEQLNFATFASAVHAADSHGRLQVVGFNLPVVCGGVRVTPGDIVAADLDGVVVIPRGVAADSIQAAAGKRRKEREAQQMLDGGASVRETYDRHGVL
jgi:4-hydroxy-4-methyl-2-oxoglutarate aldolase